MEQKALWSWVLRQKRKKPFLENFIFYGYIIESIAKGSFYIGHTDNVDRRLTEHNTGESGETKNKGPWKLVFQRAFPTWGEAMKGENELKRRKSRKVIEDLAHYWVSQQVG